MARQQSTNNGNDGLRNGNAMATAMEGATVMRWQRRLKAQQRCDKDNGDSNERRDRVTAVAEMVGTKIAMAADGKTTIN